MSDIDWLGRMPRADLKPLTPEWFRCAMQPKHQADGTILHTLTPPAKSGWTYAGVMSGLAVIAILGGAFFWPLLKMALT